MRFAPRAMNFVFDWILKIFANAMICVKTWEMNVSTLTSVTLMARPIPRTRVVGLFLASAELVRKVIAVIPGPVAWTVGGNCPDTDPIIA